METVEEQKPEGPPQCAAVVFDDRVRHWQCTRRGYALSADGKHYCKQHHPETVAERRQARDRKWKAEMEARDRAIAEADAKAREIGIGAARENGTMLLTRAEADMLIEFLVRGDAAIRDAWHRYRARVTHGLDAGRQDR